MASARVVEIVLTGTNTSLVRSVTGAEQAVNRSASNMEGAFTKASSRIGSSINSLGNVGASFGVPFASALSVVGSQIEKTEGKVKGFGATLATVGGAELLAAAAGVAIVGKSAVSAAQDFQVAQGRLQIAVQDAGQSFSEQHRSIDITNDKYIALGFTATQTENALSVLTAATHNVTASQKAMAAAADIARARNLDLNQVAIALSKAANGNYLSLYRLGIASRAQTENFKNFGQVLTYVEGIMGGQAQQYTESFAGKLAILHAEANKLEVDLGLALIPRIESLASGTIGAVQGFESLNRSTDGFLGKALAVGAAVPVAVFAVEKLGSAGVAIGGQFVKVGSAVGNALGLISDAGAATGTVLTGTETAAEILAVQQAKVTIASAAMAAATDTSAAANARLDTAIAALVVAEDGDIAAAREVAAAHDAASRALVRQLSAAEALSAREGELAVTQAAAPSGAAASLGVGEGAAVTGASAGLLTTAGALIAPLAGLAAGILIVRQAAAKDNEIKGLAADLLKTGDAARSAQLQISHVIAPDLPAGKLGKDLQAYGDAVLSNADKSKLAAASATLSQDALHEEAVRFEGAGRAAHASADELDFYNKHSSEFQRGVREISSNIDTAKAKIESLTREYGAGAIKSAELSAAQKQLRDDLTLVATGADVSGAASRRLAGDRSAVTSAGKVVAGVEKQVADATNGSTGALNSNANAANHGAYAYLGLADSVKTAVDAFQAVFSSATTAAASPYQLQIDTSAAQASALALHGKIDKAGAGGSDKTAAAILDEHTSKLDTLASSQFGVHTSAEALATAEQHFNDIMHGVGVNTQAAITAENGLTSAQDAAKSSALDLIDAQRNLADAKNTAANAGHLAQEGVTGSKLSLQSANLGVRDARSTLRQDVQNGADPETIQKDSLAVQQALLQQEQATDAVKNAQRQLTETSKKHSIENDNVKRAEIGVTEAQLKNQQSMRDLSAAQLLLNETLHGYPAASVEARAAQDQLTQSQMDALTAIHQVTHAQDDLDGKLESSKGYASAETSIGSLITRLEDLRNKSIAVADDIGNQIAKAHHSVGAGFLAAIQSLQQAVDAEPLLKGAFDSVIATLLAKDAVYESTPTKGHAFGPNRNDVTGGRASGGPVAAGQGYIVGENGPEYFQPNSSGTIIPNIDLKSSASNSAKVGADLMGGLYDGAKKTYDAKLAPFFATLRTQTTKNTKDSATWLVQPATDLMAGFYDATQTGYAPTKLFFQSGLQNDLTSGTQSATKAVETGWGSIKKAFQNPTNQTIVHVLNPLVDDVNQIAKAVGIDDILKHVPLVGSFATGGIVPATGLAKVHEGEGVIPKSAMALLTQAQFDAIKSGQKITAIDAAIKNEKPSTGAARLVDATANRAAGDVKQLLSSLHVAVQQSTSLAPFSRNISPISITPNPGGFAGALLNAQLQHKLTGIPTSVMLTQSANETGGWSSSWYRNYNNPAGIGVTGAPGAGNKYPNIAAGWADYAQKLLGNGEAGQGQFVADLHAGASALQLLRDIELSPWAGGHYGGHGLEALYPEFAGYLADGGVVKHKQGGVHAVLGERGQNELVTPLPHGFDVKKLAGGTHAPISVTFAPGSIVVKGVDEELGHAVVTKIMNAIDQRNRDNGR